MRAARARVLAAALALGLAAGSAAADSLRFCDRAIPLSAAQQDRMLRFAAVLREELEGSGQTVALVARSGLDLQRFGLRYSHAGLSLRAVEGTPWSVRQLYYACDEGRPRLFDQGLAGFVLGMDQAALGYVSVLLLPPQAGAAIERAALDKTHALRLLGADYSANAHAFSLRYQNCNQWLIELVATALGRLDQPGDLRAQAQAWLAAEGYAPAPVEVGSHLLMFAGGFIPWIHYDDHPEDDRYALRLRTSLPASIEGFLRARLPGAQRIELCHDGRQVVVRRGWQPVAEGCVPEAGDRVLPLD